MLLGSRDWGGGSVGEDLVIWKSREWVHQIHGYIDLKQLTWSFGHGVSFD